MKLSNKECNDSAEKARRLRMLYLQIQARKYFESIVAIAHSYAISFRNTLHAQSDLIAFEDNKIARHV